PGVISRTSPAAVIIHARSPATTGPPLTIGSAAGTTRASALATRRSARGVTRRIGPPMGGYSTVAPDHGRHGTHTPYAWHARRRPTSKVSLLAARAIDVRRLAEEDFRRLHDGFRQRRMRMDGQRHVSRGGAHLDRQHAFRDQFTRARTAD